MAATSYLYGGTILMVDLSTGAVTERRTADYADAFVGGRGIDARLIYELIDAATDPLGPENAIVFGTGPLSGTLFPGSSRTDVMGKSPVTGLLGNANIGGDWAAELKYAGVDHLVLTGRAPHPVLLSIRNERVDLLDARGLWGKTTYQTHELVKEALDDPEAKVLCIGPAGERLVSYATVHSNVGNAAARTGMGAVLGSKNVKALAVRGTRGVRVADPDDFFAACMEAQEAVRGSQPYERIVTTGNTLSEYSYVRSGMEAGGSAFEGAPEFDPSGATEYLAFQRKHEPKRTGCAGCPIHCMENYTIPGIGSTVLSCELWTQLNWEIRNDDMLLWYELVKRCQEMGVDNTSVAMVVQWLTILFERGLIDERVTDGTAVRWGDREAVRWILDALVNRTGLGDVLARGMAATAAHFDALVPLEQRGGESTYEYALQVNDNPMYGINPRVNGMALSYAVGRRSDCIHDLEGYQFGIVAAAAYAGKTDEERRAQMEAEAAAAVEFTGNPRAGDPESVEGKAAAVHENGVITGIADMAGSCKWHTKWLGFDLTPEHYAAALSAGLGRRVTADDLCTASLRLRNVERALECKMGRRRENDTIPRKEFGRPVSRGPWKGRLGVDEAGLERMKDEYYGLRGWDLETGVPLEETLLSYGLGDIAADLAREGILPARSPGSGRRAPKRG